MFHFAGNMEYKIRQFVAGIIALPVYPSQYGAGLDISGAGCLDEPRWYTVRSGDLHPESSQQFCRFSRLILPASISLL
jgi:hypothetical protein